MSIDRASDAGFSFRDMLDGSVHLLRPRHLVIAGFTGRERSSVESHLEELRALGVEVPEEVPAFFDLSPDLLTTADQVVVADTFTSGEVEPVVAKVDGKWFLCVGSDHTDRALEAKSIQLSKEACSKVISRDCIQVDALADWDAIEIAGWADGELYQSGTLAEMMPLAQLMEAAEAARGPLGDGDVLFLGTLPVLGGGLRAAGRFEGELRIPGARHSLRFSYTIEVRA